VQVATPRRLKDLVQVGVWGWGVPTVEPAAQRPASSCGRLLWLFSDGELSCYEAVEMQAARPSSVRASQQGARQQAAHERQQKEVAVSPPTLGAYPMKKA